MLRLCPVIHHMVVYADFQPAIFDVVEHAYAFPLFRERVHPGSNTYATSVKVLHFACGCQNRCVRLFSVVASR